jgi:hypothetical protein
MNRRGGKALNGLGAPQGYRIQSNSECHERISRSQTAGAKIRSREGKNPDQQLRSRSYS